MASEARVVRFDATERALHTVHAAAFLVMLASGLVLYSPTLAHLIAARPLVKAVHLVTAALWLTALVLVVLLGDRRTLRRTRRELEMLDVADVEWLRRRRGRAGRFNAGQKLHSAVQAALAVLFTVSGTLLWLGERDTTLRLSGSIALHDAAMWLGSILVAGHLYLALVAPDTRPALEGIVRGTVPAGYAARHHPDWVPEAPRQPAPVGLLRRGAAVVVAVAGMSAAVLLATGSL